MSRLVITGANFVSVPYQPSINSGLNSRMINDSGTEVILNDYEYAALSSTAFTSGALVDGGDVDSEGTQGIHVPRATATLPQTAAAAIFTITGGRILLKRIIGEVTTVIQTQANATKLTFDPTDAGATQNLCATTDITADAVGTIYSITGTPATGLQDSLNFGSADKQLASPGIVLKPGSILLDCAASNTGSVKWDLWYFPLDDDAVVVAA